MDHSIFGVVDAVARRIERPIHGHLHAGVIFGMDAGPESLVGDRLRRMRSPQLAHARIPLDQAGRHVPIVNAETHGRFRDREPLLAGA